MKQLLFFIPLILLSACASHKPVVVQMPRSVPGTILPTGDMESVRYGENLKAYSFGRYVVCGHNLMMPPRKTFNWRAANSIRHTTDLSHVMGRCPTA